MKHFSFLRRLIVVVGLLLAVVPFTSAQTSREHIKNKMREWGECKNVAITKTGGDLALYGTNGYGSKYCPSGLTDALSELHDNDETLVDVVLTESGEWLVLYGNNGLRWSNIPYSMEQKLREYNSNNEKIISVSFNDRGEWVIIAEDHWVASNTSIQEWLKEGQNDYGMIWSVCLTDDARVACFSQGFSMRGNYPNDLLDELKAADLDVYRIKIAGSAWFFADKYGHYNYKL